MEIKVTNLVISNFWFSTSPFFNTVVYTVPRTVYNIEEGNYINRGDSTPLTIKIFDCDGDLINNVSISTPSNECATIAIDTYCSGCKLQGGIKQGTIEISHSDDIICYAKSCDVENTSTKLLSPSLLGVPIYITSTAPIFFPILIKNDLNLILTVINKSHKTEDFKYRIIVDEVFDEISHKIPPKGCRIFSIFADFKDFECREGTQAYLRFVSKAPDNCLGYQIIEQIKSKNFITNDINNLFVSLN